MVWVRLAYLCLPRIFSMKSLLVGPDLLTLRIPCSRVAIFFVAALNLRHGQSRLIEVYNGHVHGRD